MKQYPRRFSLGQIHQKNFPLIHHVPHIEGAFRLSHNPSQNRVYQEFAHLVLDRGNGLGPEADRIGLLLAEPEPAHLVVSHVIEDMAAEIWIIQESGHIQ